MEGEEEFQIVEKVESAETLPVIEVEQLNPEGYGIGDFQPTAVFEETKNLEGIASTDTEETSQQEDESAEMEESGAESVPEPGETLDTEESTEAAEPGETLDTEESTEAAEPGEKRDDEESTEKSTEEVEDVGEGRVSITQRKSEERRRDSEIWPISKQSLLMDKFALIFPVEEEEEEEKEEEEVEQYIPIDREPYYTRYRVLIPERNSKKVKNNLLHRKMAEYFKKKKMEHVLKETDKDVDSKQKYEKKLQALAEFKTLEGRERNSTSNEVDDLRAQRDEQLDLLNDQFDAMQSREQEVGTGLINTKTGKEIPTKLVEQMIKRQKDKTTEISSKRLAYIKLRDRVTEKKEALHKLDVIGEGLHLIDYEQLQIAHTSFTDKVKERDEELTRLRFKCSGSMQSLAHVREKCAALQMDMQQLKGQYEDIGSEADDCRERLNYVKQERDNYRMSIRRMVDDSGLLTKPKLLSHMEQSLEEVKMLEPRIEEYKRHFEMTEIALEAIKDNLANNRTRDSIASQSDVTKGKSSYKGRPTLFIPTLPPASIDVYK